MSEMCCICGKALPNRWAVAGRCTGRGCDVPFCALHWRQGNQLCREHGWRPEGGMKNIEQGMSNIEGKESDMNEEQNMDLSKVPEKQGKKAMDEALKVAKAAGAGVAGLVAKIQYARSPQAMQDTINDNLEKNRSRRDEVSQSLEEVHNRIVLLKQKYEAAPPARKRTLQMELKSLMGEYKTLEREFKVLLENEQVLGTVKGRFMETLAYDLRGISEKHIDKIADKIEDKADEADDIQDAMADLEGAGRRRERDEGEDDFDAELAAFGDEEIMMADEAGETPAVQNETAKEKKKDPLDGLAEFE